MLQNDALIGAEFETLVHKQIGVQLGAGMFGYSGGIDYHFSNSIRSSSLSLQYISTGVGANQYYSTLAPQFIYRGKKWLTLRAGLGFVLSKGPAYKIAFPDGKSYDAFYLLSIGAYFPI